MERFRFDLRSARRVSSERPSVLDPIDRFVRELDEQLDRLRRDTRDEWRDLRRFALRTQRAFERFVEQSDRPASVIADGARELGRELRKSLERLG